MIRLIQCITLREKYPCLELFWSMFSRIRTEYGEIRSIQYSECRKMQTRITPNKDTFHVVSEPLTSVQGLRELFQ